jgi:alkyl hydroperoxide reductase subunit AhpC
MFFNMQPGCKVTYPILADPNREIIKQLNMVDPDEKDSSGNPLPSRALHIVGPDKKVFIYIYIKWMKLKGTKP